MTTKPDPGWKLAADDKRARLDIYDAIGDWGEFGGVSARDVRDALAAIDVDAPLDVHLNSPGGYAYDGITIFNQLDQHKGRVSVYIDGLAASAASVIAMAGDDIYMADNAILMIHNASGVAIGNASTMQKMAEDLEKLDGILARTYANRTGGDVETIRQQMADETHFTAGEALDDGFATEVTTPIAAAAAFGPEILNRLMSNDAARVAARYCNHTPSPGDDPKENPMDSETTKSLADKYPDIVADIRAEAVASARADFGTKLNEAEVKATDDATKLERERCVALADAFASHPKFLAEQIEAGHDIGKAKAAAFDAKLGGSADDGADAVNLGVTPTDDDKAKGDAKIITMAKTMKTKYAREGYLASIGRTDLADQLDD